jgi:hypothetical protein
MVYVVQSASFLFALASIFAEWAFTWPFREIKFYPDNEELDRSTKKKLSDMFHTYGGAGVAFVSLGMGASAFFICSDRTFFYAGGHFVLWTLLFAAVYWLVFDIGYALKINQQWYYLGGTAFEDHWLNNAFGKYAGALKAIVLIGLIIFMNIIN